MTQHSIIEHRANYFFIRLEDDYLAMHERINQEVEALGREDRTDSGPADCKAMISAVLEQWMNSKRPTAKCEENLYVYLTYDEWEHQLRYRYKRSTIIRCLKEMAMEGQWQDEEGNIHVGTIKVRHHVQNTYAYMLHTKVVQGLLCELPEQSPYGPRPKTPLGRPRKSHPKINGLNLNDINLNRLKTGGISEIPSENKRNNPEIPSKNTRSFYTQNNNTQTSLTQIDGDSAFASSPRTLVRYHGHDFIWVDDDLTPTLMVVKLTPAFPSRYWSEMEDKRRERFAAWEMVPYLKSKGINIEVRFEHEDEHNETVDAASENDSHYHDGIITQANDLTGGQTYDIQHADPAVRSDADCTGGAKRDCATAYSGSVAGNSATQPTAAGTKPRNATATSEPGAVSSPAAVGDALPLRAEVPPQRRAQSAHKKPKEPTKKPDLLAQAPQNVIAVVVEWQDIFNQPIPVTTKLLEHAATLAACNPVVGEIAQCRLWMYQTDTKKWYSTHGMHLGDVAREFERFRSLAHIPQPPPAQSKSDATNTKPYIPPETELERRSREIREKYGMPAGRA